MDIKQPVPVVVSRKAARELIENTLENLPELQGVMGKKFRRRLKKAGKFLAEGLPKSVSKMKKTQATPENL